MVRWQGSLSTSDPPPASPYGQRAKLEKNIQNLLIVICMPAGAALLSIARLLLPFDILLDVAVRLRCSSDTYCSLFQSGRGGGGLQVSVLIEHVGLSCTQTPNEHQEEESPQFLMPAIKFPEKLRIKSGIAPPTPTPTTPGSFLLLLLLQLPIDGWMEEQ